MKGLVLDLEVHDWDRFEVWGYGGKFEIEGVKKMKITDRDIKILGWILEQKFMTERQVRKVFWKDLTKDNREAYRRLNKLKKARFLKTNKTQMYRSAMYLVTRKGVEELKRSNRNSGLGELAEVGYSNYKHDLAVTDIRIMLYESGYTNWVSERVLSKRNDLRRVPDGMIYHRGKYLAIEYESSQKSKDRYRKIFLDYYLDNHVDRVLYIVSTPELADKILRMTIDSKPYFVSYEDLSKDLINVLLKHKSHGYTLRELLESNS